MEKGEHKIELTLMLIVEEYNIMFVLIGVAV